jgi:uncharacterized protein YbjT (DUF2867 family)
MIRSDGRTVLVAGAAGKQGLAVIQALIASSEPWQIKALTRDPTSKSAARLLALGVMPTAGDMSDQASLRKAMQGVDYVFSVQANFVDDKDGNEVRYGKNMIDAAVASGIKHFVFSSVGGAERNSGVPHFEAKRRIEQHLVASTLSWTILRPASFMDNFAILPIRTVLLCMFKTLLGPNRKLQLIATRDIGCLAALAFEKPEAYQGQMIELAGDELTTSEMIAILKKSKHRPVIAFNFPSFLMRRLPEDFPIMVKWFNEHGFVADIDALKRQHPSLMTLDDWAG